MILIHSHYYNHISSRKLELIFEPPYRHHAQLLGWLKNNVMDKGNARLIVLMVYHLN